MERPTQNCLDWFADLEELTGRGLLSRRGAVQRTVYLEPGTYAMYCFVKTPEGQAHIVEG